MFAVSEVQSDATIPVLIDNEFKEAYASFISVLVFRLAPIAL
jgi:hypothetical protein